MVAKPRQELRGGKDLLRFGVRKRGECVGLSLAKNRSKVEKAEPGLRLIQSRKRDR